ncbi:MAG: chitobiase/beta-hexosaminidase C-terminal domain-containing protein, partial [Muribaculaceae bacterium]|nr:chitobiase/beta-hexosaminidase C-terminal domain-containing protein [Muribaculaceae bacterium]
FTINCADRMGFIPVWWFDHGKGKNYSWDNTTYTSTSAFGTEAELRALIRDYKAAGTFAIEDVVINHKGGPGMWNGSGKGRNLISENSSTGAPSTSNDVEWNYDDNVDIVDDDAHDYWNQYPYLENGNIKSESGFTGGTWGKDLRHDSENVQNNVVKYLNFLLNDLGYAGFRYDYVKGYDPKYLAMYNVATRPTFSVGEFFDGDQAYLESWIDKTYAEDTRQSAAFDFPLKFKMNEAFKNDEGNYAVLDNAGLIANYKMRRYAVTFVDNHDTFKNIPNDNTHRGFPNRMSKHVVEANMFILAMPGTPCLFYPHYMHPSWQPILQKCIKARRAAGVTNQAAISSVDKSGKHVQFNITGTKGKLKMQLGSTYSNAAVPEGYEVVHKEGDCRLLISTGLDWQNNVKETLIGGYATIDKMSGNYTSAFDVNIGASNNATQVVYTTNGTTPDAGSAKAPATLHITGSTTVKAGVVVNGVVDENSVVIRDYVMDHNDETGKIKVYISYANNHHGDSQYGYSDNPCVYAFKGDTKYTGDWPGWTGLSFKENVGGVDWYVATIPASDIDLILHRGGSNSALADVSKSATIKNVTHDIFLTYTDGVAHDVTAMYGSALHDPKLSIDAPSGTYEGSLKVNLNSTRDDPYVGQKKAQIVYVTWAAGETP